MAGMLPGDEVTVSVKNTFFDFECPKDEGRCGTLKRSSSEGELSFRSSSNSKSSSRKTYTWKPSSNASAQDVDAMSHSSFASCSETTPWNPPWEVQDVSVSDAYDVSNASGAPLLPCSDLVKAVHEESGMAIEDLQRLESEGVLELIPRNDAGELASVGSLQHSIATCTPCIFWFRGMCTKSLKCPFCHFSHPGQRVKKPNKRTRELMRAAKKNKEGEEETATTEPARKQEQHTEADTMHQTVK